MRKTVCFYGSLPVALIAVLLGGCSNTVSGSDAAVEWYRSMYSDADIERGCDQLGSSAPGLDWYPGISFGDVAFTLTDMQRGWNQLCPQEAEAEEPAEEFVEEPAAEEPAEEQFATPAEEPASESELGVFEPAEEDIPQADVASGPPDPVRTSCGGDYEFDDELPISVCSRGESVRLFQEILGVEADGYFGPGTQAALIDLQETYGLPVTRRIDAATWAYFGVTSNAPYPDLNGDGVVDASEFPG